MTRRKYPVRATLISAIKLTWPEGPVPALTEAEAALVRLAVETSRSAAEAARRLGITAKQLQVRLRRLSTPACGP